MEFSSGTNFGNNKRKRRSAVKSAQFDGRKLMKLLSLDNNPAYVVRGG